MCSAVLVFLSESLQLLAQCGARNTTQLAGRRQDAQLIPTRMAASSLWLRCYEVAEIDTDDRRTRTVYSLLRSPEDYLQILP